MNRENAKEILNAFGKPKINIGNKVLSFSRQDEEDISEIENKTDEELIEQWKSLVYLNEIYGQVCLNEMQRIALIELEFEDRESINAKELYDWFDQESENYNNEDYENFHD